MLGELEAFNRALRWWSQGFSMNNLTFGELKEINETRSLEWAKQDTDNRDNLEFRTIDLAGEAGEVADAVKKLLRLHAHMPGSTTIEQSVIDIGEELADTIISADRVASALDINLSDAIRRKFNITSDKYGFITKF